MGGRLYGWRGKIGIIFPATGNTEEPEFYKMAPEGVSVHTARIGDRKLFSTADGSKGTISYLTKMAEDAMRAADQLAAAKVDVILYLDTSGSFVKGKAWEVELSRSLEDASGIKTITTSHAMVDALREMDIQKVAVATPYSNEITQLLKVFLEEYMFTVVKTAFLGLFGSGFWAQKVSETSPGVAYRIAKEADDPEADGIFISCTEFRTIEVIESLEEDLQKPVITANQASMWAALRSIKFRKPISGFGQLLAKL